MPVPTFDLAAYSAALVDENARLADLVAGADPGADVPTCPGWTVRKLAAHVGRGHRWAATIVATRSVGPVDPRTVDDGRPPVDPAATAAWVRAGADVLLAAVAEVGPDTAVWTFTGPKPAGWWVRRRLHEATAHRGDAAIALGVPFALDPGLGADGVGEWLDLLVARRGDPLLPDGTTLHLHATDGDLGTAGEWTLRPDGDVLAWGHAHTKASCAVCGAAGDLYLGLLRRIDAEDPRLEVLGDRDVLARFLATTPF